MCWKYTCSHLQSTLLNIHLPWEREPVRPVSMSCWCLPQVVVSSQYTFLNTNNYYNFLCDQFCLHLIQSNFISSHLVFLSLYCVCFSTDVVNVKESTVLLKRTQCSLMMEHVFTSYPLLIKNKEAKQVLCFVQSQNM